ncbi:MAG: protein kinase [Acidobacteria bacterium]|nr:protein kinase [Acidobacteriota bacterium]MCW5970656.1 protein kinase [Blastocatellales bacterium]
MENLAHYQILKRIGAGGMGEVYLAEDTRLGRKVALKLLPREFTDDAVRVRRFEQEARAASALNHPNIITIYEIGQADGHQYIATEYIEGETVRRLLSHGYIRLLDTLDIAIQTAQALEAAHRVGIIHRDIKPENIMRRPDGYIKILDFGLAKLTERGATGDDAEAPKFQTDPGTVLGTVAYMSPEQARGLPVDARSDLFSLGVVLYEMLTGRRPFTGATSSDILVAILDREPAPPSTHLPTLPEDLNRIVNRLLVKDAAVRYSSAGELLADLRRVKTFIETSEDSQPTIGMSGVMSGTGNADTMMTKSGETAADPLFTRASPGVRTRETHAAATSAGQIPARRSAWIWAALGLFLVLGGAAAALLMFMNREEKLDSLAVLPFSIARVEGNAENIEYLSDGITEGLINSLSQLPELNVKSRNAVLRFKGAESDARAVGRDLGVRAVLLGRIKQEGRDLVISTELVQTSTQRQIWGESFRRSAEDLLALQEQITGTIAARLRMQLSDAERRALAARPTNSAEAYELYLRGRYYWNQGTPEALKKADEYFERAAGLDPGYTLAIAGCAACHAHGADEDEPPSASMPKAKQVALVALKQNENLASAHLVLARVAWMYDWDFAAAERKFLRAIELEPGNTAAMEQYAEFLAHMGRDGEAIVQIDRVRAIDPASPQIDETSGRLYYYRRRYDQSIAELERALRFNPNSAPVREGMGLAFEQKRMQPEAVEQYLMARRIADDRPDYLPALKDAYARGRWEGFWKKELAALQERASAGYVPASRFAEIHLRLQDRAQALLWLAKAYDERDARMVALKVDPLFDPLRGEARFEEIVRRVGLGQ